MNGLSKIQIIVVVAVAMVFGGAILTYVSDVSGQAEDIPSDAGESVPSDSSEVRKSKPAIVNNDFEDPRDAGWRCFTGSVQTDFDTCNWDGYTSDQAAGSHAGYVQSDRGACGMEGFGQRIRVPDDTTKLVFQIKSRHGGCSSPETRAGVYVLKDGNVVAKRIIGTGQSGWGKWEQRSIDLSSHAGQTVTLVVGSRDTSARCGNICRGYEITVDEFHFEGG